MLAENGVKDPELSGSVILQAGSGTGDDESMGGRARDLSKVRVSSEHHPALAGRICKALCYPESRFLRTNVQATIDAAEVALTAFRTALIKHRRAFAAWVSLRDR